jgi:glycerol-3-phosphate acyltransferase PlsX
VPPAPDQITVAVDANGADQGPGEVAKAAAEAAASGVRVRVFGPRDELGDAPEGVEFIDAPVSVAKMPNPTRAVRSTPEASIVQAATDVAEGRSHALVCGGSTGAALAAGLLHIRRSPGIHRPALALPLPLPAGTVLLLDCGANTEARPEHLVQFAYMGSAFSRAVLGVENPKVALLSNGEEPERGTDLVVNAHRELADRTGLNFIGNVEGTTLTEAVADVVVADGFSGNLALKLLEGGVSMMLGALRDAAVSSPRAKVGALLMRPAVYGIRDQLDPERTAGAYLLGLRRPLVVFHGRFSQRGIAEAIRVAQRAVVEHVIERTSQALEAAGAMRDGGDAAAATSNVSP